MIPMPAETPPAEILAALTRMGLPAPASTTDAGERLTGGVSSDIWRIDLPTGPVCVKRALAKLRVAADWRAPIERNQYEAAWMRRANAAAPGSAPALLGQDTDSGALAMAFLPPEKYRLWKTELRNGNADPIFATQVARTLVRIHADTAADASVAAEFPTDKIFYDIRLEPYLIATARAHPDLTDVLHTLVRVTQSNKRTLVHGDVSPKNILIGPDGPVFLDAECAWWGDPAFDLAFCLNHLLLKCLWTPSARNKFFACFDVLAETYLTGVTWEPRDALQTRIAHLLPGLLLARVDGKSPAEYITEEADKNRVRRTARALLTTPVATLSEIHAAWSQELTA
ncbi:MAG: aminoglycoside phosphotransferase family protein [Acetobacteraceae bacterium]|nr:aminoglycoside phosphotransferase family protein [Acetobacteraceae bacterium]